jgi:hypothetical protein
VAALCRQCGSNREPRAGRCRDCGALIDARAGVRAQRREALREALSFNWLDWFGEILGVVLIVGIAVDGVPAWTIVIAVIFIVRPFFGLALRVAARALGEGP